VEKLAALTSRPSRRAFDRLFAPTADRNALYDQVRIAAILCGATTVGEVTASDGERRVTVQLRGAKATVRPEAPSGKFVATVTTVDSMIDAASGTFGVRLELPNPGLRIPAGAKCKIAFGGK
jgi:multidrug efflux pump subunit AcrA (membrane-fusion protein)